MGDCALEEHRRRPVMWSQGFGPAAGVRPGVSRDWETASAPADASREASGVPRGNVLHSARRAEARRQGGSPGPTIKRGVLRALRATGAFERVARSNWRGQRLFILGYHGISTEGEHEWDPQLYMPVSQFEERMETLQRLRCNVLPLAEGLRRLYAGALPSRAVCITFDDGLYNFYSAALPVLEHYHYPATLYLTTYYSSHQFPVFPLICSYLRWLSGQTKDCAIPSGLSASAQDEFASELAATLGIDYSDLRRKRILHLMTGDEVSAAATRGVDIQLHTHRHRLPADRESFRDELAENSRRIESLTGRTPSHFCYPDGAHRPELLPWLQDLDIGSAVTCQPDLASRSHNPLLIPRLIDTSTISQVEFESWVTGLYPWGVK